MKGKINSLNVSAAISAILFERQRQLNQQEKQLEKLEEKLEKLEEKLEENTKEQKQLEPGKVKGIDL